MVGYLLVCVFSPEIPHNSDDSSTKQMVLELLNADAHTDFVNSFGECPHSGFLKSEYLYFTN